jgi:hypothetical protein
MEETCKTLPIISLWKPGNYFLKLYYGNLDTTPLPKILLWKPGLHFLTFYYENLDTTS